MQKDPAVEHSGKDIAAGDSECVAGEQPEATTSVLSASHTKHASSNSAVEMQHDPQPQDELQTSLLEAARVEDTSTPEPTEVSFEYIIYYTYAPPLHSNIVCNE